MIYFFIPLLGTIIGSYLVFFVKEALPAKVEKALLGFASGVMIAASVWSLLLPAFAMSQDLKEFAFVPALVGFLIGVFFLLGLDELIPHIHVLTNEEEGHANKLSRSFKILLAIVLHNIPEGLATGAVVNSSTLALPLVLGIAIQNIPEGIIVALPLKNESGKALKAFLWGSVSGLMETVAALIAFYIAGFDFIMPYFLGFAAGAMIYVTVEELIPEMSLGKHSNIGTIFLALGFALLIAMDTLL